MTFEANRYAVAVIYDDGRAPGLVRADARTDSGPAILTLAEATDLCASMVKSQANAANGRNGGGTSPATLQMERHYYRVVPMPSYPAAEAVSAAEREAQEEVERAERAARNLAKAHADLKAANIEFEPRPSDRFVTVRNLAAPNVILGTMQRAAVYSREPAWTFFAPDGRKVFEARSEFMACKELLRARL